MYSFCAQLFLFGVNMIVAHTQFDYDDIQTEGVHMRIVITVIQVIILQVVLLAYLALSCVVTVVKRDRKPFVVISMPTTPSRNAQVPPTDTVTLQNTADAIECVDDAESNICSQQHTLHEDEIFTEDDVSVSSVFDDPAVVFERGSHLDLYVLYVNIVGLVLWQTMLSFNFKLYNSNLIFVMGIASGWFWSQLYARKTTQPAIPLAHFVAYTCAFIAVCGICCDEWHQHAELDTLTNINLLLPSFASGVFWTAISSNMSFEGAHIRSQGIMHDSQRALPTFLLVMSVAALYSSPETRTDVFIYIKSLSRMASMHLFMIEPISKFTCIYVTIIALERKQATNVTMALVVVQGFSYVLLQPYYDGLSITLLIACVLLATIHATWMTRLRAGP